jgi:hypothetical protein
MHSFQGICQLVNHPTVGIGRKKSVIIFILCTQQKDQYANPEPRK